MLAYAPRRDRRRISPPALALVIIAHAAAIAAIMSVRMDMTPPWKPGKTEIKFVPLPPVPKPDEPARQSRPSQSQLDTVDPILPPLPSPGPKVEPLPMPLPFPGPVIGPSVDPLPVSEPLPARTGPRFVTPDHALRPPYPEDKRRLEEEATLRLRLSIDERGRVVAVEPVGRADPVFLEAARRHILKAWRYKPATEGGKAVGSSTVITLEFRLDH